MPDDPSATAQVTMLLHEYANGNNQSLNQVVEIVYEELHRIASTQRRRSSVGAQLQTTVLVHEAYEKLLAGQTQQPQDRKHFFAIAARAMRQIVVDSYRANQAAKRGGGALAVTLTASHLLDIDQPHQIITVHRALETLSDHNPELAELVDLACFAGLPTQQLAQLTNSNVRTVQRKLQRAQAWLAHFMSESSTGDSSVEGERDT